MRLTKRREKILWLLVTAAVAGVVIIFAVPDDESQLSSGLGTLNEKDSGRTYIYREAERFSILLPESNASDVFLQCEPQGAVGRVSNLPETEEGKRVDRFETVREGLCRISIGNFSVTIRVDNSNIKI